MVGANMAGRDVRLSRQPAHEHRRGRAPRRGLASAPGTIRRPRSITALRAGRSEYRKLLFHGGRAHRRDHLRARGRHLDHQRRGHAEGARAVGGRTSRPGRRTCAESLRRQARVHRARTTVALLPETILGRARRKSPQLIPAVAVMSPTATTDRAKQSPKPAATPMRPAATPASSCASILTTGKLLGRAVDAEEIARVPRRHRPRRQHPLRRGAGAKVQWDHPDNRLIMATGPLAGLPVWGTGGLTVVTRGAHDQRRHLHAGQRLLRRQSQVLGLRRHRAPGAGPRAGSTSTSTTTRSSCATRPTSSARTPGRRRTRWRPSIGLRGHQLSVYCDRPRRARTWCASPAIQGDYGHVASKNGCGAVMGNKRLKAVCHRARHQGACGPTDPRGLSQAADDIAHDLQDRPVDAARSTTTARCPAS